MYSNFGCVDDDDISAEDIFLDKAEEIVSESDTPGYISAQKDIEMFQPVPMKMQRVG